MAEQKKKREVIKKLRSKYRMVVINDDTFAEKFSILLTPLNVFTIVGVVVIAFSFALISVIAFTPVREFIPGYSDLDTRRKATYAAFKADSLQVELAMQKQYLYNIRAILEGRPTNNFVEEAETGSINYDTIQNRRSRQDSLLRKQIENEERFNLTAGLERNQAPNIGSIFLFPPLKGVITSSFNPSIKHYGVDLASKENEAVKATYEGTVVTSTWTSEDGHVLQIQHPNDLISVYKHNSILLKKVGDQVKAGEAIAIVGNSGENTTGPHLHFELWHKGIPIDPQNFLLF